MDNRPSDDRISERKAALVLDRATQLDAAGGREMSVAELREVALEAGISPEAFERALEEVRGMRDGLGELRTPLQLDEHVASEHRPEPRSAVSSVLYRAKILAGGLAIGLFSVILWQRLNMGDAGIIFGLVVALFAAVGLVLDRRREGSVLGSVLNLEVDLAALWVGLTFMLMLADPSDAEEVLAVMSVIGGAAGLAGAALVALPGGASRPKALPEET